RVLASIALCGKAIRRRCTVRAQLARVDTRPRLGQPRCERRPSRTKLRLTVKRLKPEREYQMNGRPNIVLIHGAWAEGSCWSGVIERLQADGFHVRAPQFPLSSLADDVARLRQVLEFQDGPTLTVGHSYGGQIMTALADAPN